MAATAEGREAQLVVAGATPKLACGVVGEWKRVADDEHAFADRPVVALDGARDGGTGCARTQLLRWHFSTTSDTPRGLLTLRARYQHGFVAYLDGVEVARRRVAGGVDSLATDLHGPEWERIPLIGVALSRGEHVLAVEAHPRTAGREPSFDAALEASDAPRITHGPYLLDVGTTSARVAFETDAPTTATVRYDKGRVANDVSGQRHVITLSGLRPSTSYDYRVQLGDDAETARIPFHTEPLAGRPLRFVIYGDVRSGHDTHAELVRSILHEDPDLAIMTGDLVDMGSDEGDWDRYFEIATPLLSSVPVYPAPGNHEYARGGRGQARFRALFDITGPSWRSFEVAGVHFIALDSNQYRSAEQLAWLRHDLESAKHSRAIVAYAHEGAYSSGLHGDNEIAKTQYAPLLEKAGATLYVGGHDHHYERGRVGTLDYIVSGGGGAELRSQRCGLPGKKSCPPRVKALFNQHNYIVVDVLPKLFRVCAKRPDGTPLEACVTRALPR
ncbi:MAG: metallophosphoesterase family protein [Polyangia bacterium]